MQKSNGYMMRKIFRVCVLCILTCVLCTCAQQLQEQIPAGGDSPRTVTVFFGGDGRAAMPDLPEGINYEVIAKCPGEDTVTRNVSGGSTHCELELSGTGGTVWTITVNAYVEDPDAPILTGTTELTVPAKAATVSLLYRAEPGTGDVALKIGVDSATGVTKLTVSGTGTNLDGDYPATDSTITINKTGIAAGTYDALFSFYNESGVLIACCLETINVRANLTTGSWITAGASILIDGEGNFSLTPESVTTLTDTTLYVKGTGGTLGFAGNDRNTGTWAAPFATLQTAVNRVIALNNAQPAAGVAYTILIDGAVEYGTSGVDMAVINPGNNENKLNLTICGRNATDSLSATASRILYIGANASVTVTNLTLTGGTGASTLYLGGFGGGVYVDGGTFTLGSGGVITGCTATGSGGGVAVYKGTFDMTSGSISGNTAATAGGGVYVSGSGTFNMTGGTISGNEANGSSSFGGGVYVYNGTFNMSAGTAVPNIAGNSATSGGGVCVHTDSTFNMSAGTIGGDTLYDAGAADKTTMGNKAGTHGGGIYVDSGTFNMSADTVVPNISGNTAGTHGGGIYVCGTGAIVSLAGGTIGKNSANTGGGVYAGDTGVTATLTIEGSTIDSNTATVSGGGVYINTGVTFNMTAGIVSNNEAATNGGGVYIGGGSDKEFSGGEISGNKAKNGGGIYASEQITLSGVAVTGNTATATATATANGGGVHLSGSDSNHAMTGGSISGNVATSAGGGVYIGGGKFTMSGGIIGSEVTGLAVGTQITADEAPTAKNCSNSAVFGGGIYIAGGTVTMTGDSAVAFNYASAAAWPGGGVYVAGGTFNCGQSGDSKPQIYANAANVRGGGVCMYGGEMNLYGSIRHNYSEAASGGVEVGSGSTVTMYSGASIHDNLSAPGYGGGVHMSGNSNGRFDMTGGTITNNASGSGTELSPELWVQNEQFSMSGDAVVTTTGDAIGVMLPGSATITVGNLAATADGGAQIAAVVACINEINNNAVEAVYTEGTPILSFADTLPDEDRIAACARFKIPNDADGNMYSVVYDSVKGQGVLKKSAITVTLFGTYKLVSEYTATDGTISLTVTDSDDNPAASAVTAATIALYQNGLQVSGLTSTGAGGTMPSLTLPSWLPAGTYQLYITAEINGSTYSGYADIEITL